MVVQQFIRDHGQNRLAKLLLDRTWAKFRLPAKKWQHRIASQLNGLDEDVFMVFDEWAHYVGECSAASALEALEGRSGVTIPVLFLVVVPSHRERVEKVNFLTIAYK